MKLANRKLANRKLAKLAIGLLPAILFQTSCTKIKELTDEPRVLAFEGRMAIRPNECNAYEIVGYNLEAKKGLFPQDTQIALSIEDTGSFYSDAACTQVIKEAVIYARKQSVRIFYKNPSNKKVVLLKGEAKDLGAAYLPIAVELDTLDGVLDPSFNGTGKVTTDMGNKSYAKSLAIQADGKIVVAGSAYNGSNDDFAVVRYHPNGSLDMSFDGDGKLTTQVGASTDHANGVAIQSDGKIVVAGVAYNGSNYDFALVRYNTNGSLDTSFDGDGKLTTQVGTSIDYATGVAIQSDGKIVVAGYSYTGSNNYDFAVVRYHTDGSLDTSFGGNGKRTTQVGTSDDFATGVAIQSDGKIVVAGEAYNGSNFDFALVRYNPNGSLDTSFDGDGKLTTAVGTSYDYANGVAIQSDGKIVVAGVAYNGSNFDFALVRYNPNGSLDTSFDGDGKLTTQVGTSTDYANGVAIQSDGKIVVAGSAYTGSNDDFAVVRYNTNGSLDTNFGQNRNGKVIFPIGSSTDFAHALALQSDGRIVVAGSAYNPTLNRDQFAVARLGASRSLGDLFKDFATFANLSIDKIKNKLRELEDKLKDDGTPRAVVLTGPVEIRPSTCRQYVAHIPLGGNKKLGSNVKVTLSGEQRGTLHLASTCSDAPIKELIVRSSTNSSSFYFKDTFSEPVLLNATSPDLISGYLAVAVRGGDPKKLALRGPQTLSAGTCGTYTLETRDESNVASFILRDTKISISGVQSGKAYSDNRCTREISRVKILVGNVTKDFYFKNNVTEILNLAVESPKLSRASLRVQVISSGTSDTSFGSGGTVTTPVSRTGHAHGMASALQSDGKIVVAGYAWSDRNYDFAVTRYNSDGSADGTFGGGTGVVNIPVGRFNDYATALLIQPDGKIVVGGYSDMGRPTYYDFSAIRLGSNGSLDSTFGSGGKITTSIGQKYDYLQGLALQPDGKIIAAGHGDVGTQQDVFLVRYNTNGSLDNVFGTNGIVRVAFSPADDYARAVLIQSDGKILIAGSGKNNGNLDFLVARFHSVDGIDSRAGALDSSFGRNGAVFLPVGLSSDYARSMALGSDGKFVIGGHASNGNNMDFALAKINADGSRDLSFGTQGVTLTPMGPAHDFGQSLVIQQPDGKIALGGYASNGNDYDFAIAYYLPNGSLDTSFGANRDGRLLSGVGSSTDYGRALALQGGGNLILAGSSYDTLLRRYRFALARYRASDSGSGSGSGQNDLVDDLNRLKDDIDAADALFAFLGPVKIRPSQCNAYTARATYRFKDFLPTPEDEQRGVAPSLQVSLTTNGDGGYYGNANCTSAITGITLNLEPASNDTYKGTFYFKDSTVGPTLLKGDGDLINPTALPVEVTDYDIPE